VRRLTPWRLSPGFVDWSPNGRWIAFNGGPWQDENQHNVWVVHPNGRDLRITHTFGYRWLSVSFSPAGKFITVGRAPGHGSAGNADVYVMRVDASHLRNITNSYAWESNTDWGPRPSGATASQLRHRPADGLPQPLSLTGQRHQTRAGSHQSPLSNTTRRTDAAPPRAAAPFAGRAPVRCSG
jgi:uncharacterized protein with WD repeat